jgi:hypothetical protein
MGHYHKDTGETDGETAKINEGIDLVFQKGSDSDFEMVVEHGFGFWKMRGGESNLLKIFIRVEKYYFN